MKFAVRLVVLCLLLVLSSTALHAQLTIANSGGQQLDDPHRAELYNCWYANREHNQTAAYDCGKRFLDQFGAPNDAYDQAIAKFVWEYDNPDKVKFEGLFHQVDAGTEANQPALLARLFATGARLLKREPENLSVLLRLGYAGYVAEKLKIDTYNADSAAAAQAAITQIEAGRAPDDSFRGYPAVYVPRSAWIPFPDKDDALAHLQYALGFLYQGKAPERAAGAFYRATQVESELKKDPLVYALLAIAYDSSAWEKASRRYRGLDQAPQPERDAALQTLFAITDRLLVYYAHAVTLSGDDPSHRQIRETASARLEVLYKFRHENSNTGMADFARAAGQAELSDPDAPFATPVPAAG